MKHLVVISPFGGREVGEAIIDAGEIEAVLAGEHAHHVVQAEGGKPKDKPVEPAVPETKPDTAPARARKSKNRE